MPHSSTILPGDHPVRSAKFGWKAVSCFPNDPDVIDYPNLEQAGANAFFLCVRQLFTDPADRCRDTGSRSRSVLIRGSLPVSLSDGHGRWVHAGMPHPQDIPAAKRVPAGMPHGWSVWSWEGTRRENRYHSSWPGRAWSCLCWWTIQSEAGRGMFTPVTGKPRRSAWRIPGR